MKNFLSLILGLMLLAPFAHAETSPKAATAAGSKSKALIETTQGKISTMNNAGESDVSLGAFHVQGASGKSKEFKLIAKSKFFSSSSAPIAFEDLKKGDQVTVLSVVTLKGDNNVISVTKNK